MSNQAGSEHNSLRSTSKNKGGYGTANNEREASTQGSMNIQDPLIPNQNNEMDIVRNSERSRFTTLAIICQTLLIFLFFIFTDYEKPNSTEEEDTSSYIYFQHINVMIFIGFGYLMTFLRRYSFGSITFNMLLGVLCIQWSMFTFGVAGYISDTSTEFGIGSMNLDIDSLINGVIAAATILISFGAVLGRATPSQLLMMAMLEMIFYTANFYVVIDSLGVTDVGGSIVVHSFGAYFGLGVSFMLHKVYQAKFMKEEQYNESNYKSDLFSMVGTLFLWIYWPSFNGVAPNDALSYGHTRCFVNTVLSLCACTVSTIGINSIFEPKRKMEMVYIQNATLAGGVAIGAAADLYVTPGGALAVGLIGGILSCVGFKYISPFLETRFNIYDTCGVHNLHGIPGVLGGVFSFIIILVADTKYYPSPDTAFSYSSYGKQAGIQLIGVLVTMVVALISGGITGFLITMGLFNRVVYPFNDMEFFSLPQFGDKDKKQDHQR